MADEELIGLHTLKPDPGSRHRRKRVGRGEGSGMGKTSGRGHKGAGQRSRPPRAGEPRGRPDADPHAAAQAARPAHEEVDAVRAVRPHADPAGEPARPRARFDDGAEVTPEALSERGLAIRKGVPVKILGQGDLSKKLTVHAHGFSKSAREKIESAGGTCQVARALRGATRVIGTLVNSVRIPEIRKKLMFTAAMLALYRHRLVHPGARHQHRRDRGHLGELLRVERPRLPEPLLRRVAPALRDLRARDHAVHHGLDHPAAAAGRGALAREAPQGRRGRAAEDHAVHALPHRRPGVRQSIGYVFLFRSFGVERRAPRSSTAASRSARSSSSCWRSPRAACS